MGLTAKDLSLDPTALELLREVEGGARVFEPEADTKESLDSFQQKVKLLRELESRRYIIEINGLNMANCDGRSVIDKVCLRGGLTEKGKAILAYHHNGDINVLAEKSSAWRSLSIQFATPVNVHHASASHRLQRSTPRLPHYRRASAILHNSASNK